VTIFVPAPPLRALQTCMSDELTSPEAGSQDLPADDAARDLAWMARVKTGDTEAFRELIEAHQHRIIGTVAKMLSDDSDAQDIAQQVFIRVWKSAPRYEPTAKFTTWLFKITRNLVFNEMRRRKRHPTFSLDATTEADDRPFQTADPGAKSPDATLQDAEMQAAIQAAIDTLPETQRMAVILRRYEDISYEEIAEILDLSVPAVKSVLFRARTELRAKLRQYLDA
jgi:RNA polymerase sigma-70 factor (ECF subfamily)